MKQLELNIKLVLDYQEPKMANMPNMTIEDLLDQNKDLIKSLVKKRLLNCQADLLLAKQNDKILEVDEGGVTFIKDDNTLHRYNVSAARNMQEILYLDTLSVITPSQAYQIIQASKGQLSEVVMAQLLYKFKSQQ